MTDVGADVGTSTPTPAAPADVSVPVDLPTVEAAPAPPEPPPSTSEPQGIPDEPELPEVPELEVPEAPTSTPAQAAEPQAPAHQVDPDLSQAAEKSQPAAEPPPARPADRPPITIKDRLAQALEKIRFNKRRKLDKIVQLAQQKRSITNDDVQIAVRVSDSTATRYLNQLVVAGKLRRSGETAGIVYEPV